MRWFFCKRYKQRIPEEVYVKRYTGGRTRCRDCPRGKELAESALRAWENRDDGTQ